MHVLVLLAGCTRAPIAAQAPIAGLDAVAPDYVRLILAIGEHEPGYVDAYYGPPEWADAAKANPRTLEELEAEADRLLALVEASAPTDPLERRRRAFLAAHLTAARFRLDMIGGLHPSFADEARTLFATPADLKPLTAYD